jgi:2-polyprenyl-3-methyl-5-hydroxy-6-metoxy-1,4-benzoquinol methylase
MFEELQEINKRPAPFEFYTAPELWTNEHTSKQMLQYHLNEDIGVSSRNINFINRSVNWIIDRFSLNSDSHIIDFGCGPGLYTTRFAEKGIPVTGIDFSERSLDYAKDTARQKNLSVSYIHKNYLELETDQKFDLVTMIMCDFCALSPSQRKTMLPKFKHSLKPNGFILLDVYSLVSYKQREECAIYEFNQLNNFWFPDDYYCFVNTFKYDEEKVILEKYTIIEKARTRVVYNWLQYFSESSLKKEFEDHGFKVEGVFSDVCGKAYNEESPEIAICARKN